MSWWKTEAFATERLHGMVDFWAAATPDAIALDEPGRVMSYAELQHATVATAHSLRALGVRPGDRVLLVAENSIALCVVLFALSRIDAWAVLANARLAPREIDNVIAHAQPRRVVFTTRVSAQAAAHAQRHGAAAAAFTGVGELGAVAIGASFEAAEPEPVFVDAQRQVAALLYTSGTSGQPKGVMQTHANLIFLAQSMARNRSMTPADRNYGVGPYAHIAGLLQLLSATGTGAASVIDARYAPDLMAHALSNRGLTLAGGVPAMWAKLLEWYRVQGRPVDAPQLRCATTGGAPMAESLKREFETAFGQPLLFTYGMTECTPIAYTRPEAPRADLAVGPPANGMAVRILGPDGGPRAIDEVGEVQVRGPAVMKGYYRNPEHTASAIDADGWLSTGDLGRQDQDGVLFIVGRTKELIIRSGFNVYPAEVEEIINAFPLVAQSAVVGRSVADNEEVIAFVEPVKGAALEPAALKDYLRRELAGYKVPTSIVLMDALPATPTGKILKNQLKLLAESLQTHS